MFQNIIELDNDFVNKTKYDQNFLLNHKLCNDLGFPPSYIEYVCMFGWGRLCNLFLIYVPLKKTHPDSWGAGSKYIRKLMNDFYGEIETEKDIFPLLEPDGSVELVNNAIPFAMSENGEYLIWDVLNPNERGEFPIYVIASRMGGIRYGGDDLLHFIKSCIDDDEIKKVMGSGYTKLPPSFEPLNELL